MTGAVVNDWFSLDLRVQAERLYLGELPDRVRAVDGTLEDRPGHVVLRVPLRSER
ncbi:hypothetical protein OG809_21860 [Kribbella soli]